MPHFRVLLHAHGHIGATLYGDGAPIEGFYTTRAVAAAARELYSSGFRLDVELSGPRAGDASANRGAVPTLSPEQVL